MEVQNSREELDKSFFRHGIKVRYPCIDRVAIIHNSVNADRIAQFLAFNVFGERVCVVFWDHDASLYI